MAQFIPSDVELLPVEKLISEVDQEVEFDDELASLQREEVIPGNHASQIAVFESQKENDWGEEGNKHGHLESVEKNRDSSVL